jgi:[protein-PII] uridylyltransferase
MSANLIEKNIFFNPEEFILALGSGNSALNFFKQTVTHANQHFSERFEKGELVSVLLAERAAFIDQILVHAWQLKINTDLLSLVAVGGYGRGELYPESDIDLMIIQPWRIDNEVKKQIEDFLRFLWDIGMEVGHSVRNVRDCVRQAKADITVATNIMESRILTGREDLYVEMKKATGPSKIWPARKFFESKWNEQKNRHQRFNDTDHNLEPNIKEGPGGLRDIQMIGWVAKRHFNVNTLKELIAHDFLTQDEFEILDVGYEFLSRLRFALHLITGRREDRLLFDYQRKVAEKFGYVSNDNSAIESFMKRFYHTISELSRLNEMLLQHFQEAIIYAKRKEKITPINKRFQIRNNFLEARHNNTFKNYPFALLELFLLKQQNPKIVGVRASTIRQVRESLDLINDKFRNDIRNKSLFMEIIRQPRFVGHELRRMHRYGVLGAYLPEFAAIEGLMQFDLFHVYTVDEHILSVLQKMRQFTMDEYAKTYPLACQLMKAIPKHELLFLAGMFHDIAKGRGGDHSEIGIQDALLFCRNHQLSEYDSRLVAWLVENHLIMSKTTQREDLSDPEVINRFAVTVGDEMHLDYLYLLTVADINGTNPKLWNSWKAALMIDLYKNTQLALRRGLENPIDKEERISELKAEAIKLLGNKIESQKLLFDTWLQLGDDYFIYHSADEIAWHTQAITKVSSKKLPLIIIREMTARGASEIFIYMHDHENIFSRITKTLGRLNLNILDARIITSINEYTLDTFIVMEENGEIISGKERINEIETMLHENLSNFDKPIKTSSRFKSRRLKNFPIPTQVFFSQDEKNKRTIMEVSATDRPGFLSAIGSALEQCQTQVLGAKIATYGERVEDIFFIKDRDNLQIRDEEKFQSLKNTISHALKETALMP